ncbi:hypothetical protein [Vibrio mediterranei]|uniref:hypothetical protein n=1 Tax=Vibrio mediterranei TaxID=689 RepID=UPI0040685AF4
MMMITIKTTFGKLNLQTQTHKPLRAKLVLSVDGVEDRDLSMHEAIGLNAKGVEVECEEVLGKAIDDALFRSRHTLEGGMSLKRRVSLRANHRNETENWLVRLNKACIDVGESWPSAGLKFSGLVRNEDY